MDNFDAHKWFKKEYLGEGHTKDKSELDQAIRRYDQLSDDDKLKLAKIQAMMDRERSLREDNLNEIDRDTFNMMEGTVNKETYRRFINSLDDLLDDWYMEGFEKSDVMDFMEVIIPSN